MSSPSELTLVGGTHVRASPCFHFLEVTWQSYMKLMSLTVSLQLIRPGFYPRGGGEVRVHIQPVTQLHGLSLLDRGSVAIHGFSAIARLPDHVAARQARRTVHRLKELGLRADLVEESWPGGPGSVLGLIVDMEPVPTLFFGLGERGKPAERVADEAVDQVAEFLSAAPAPVDPYSGDQVLLPLALAEGPSEYRVAAVTQHLLTNLAVVRKFVDREITCEEEEGRQGLVRIV
jgi:RNA 3'-terminal phosphate cyclase (ATP)